MRDLEAVLVRRLDDERARLDFDPVRASVARASGLAPSAERMIEMTGVMPEPARRTHDGGSSQSPR